MKTIEQRADEFIGHPFECDEGTPITMSRVSYIQGAEDQKAIDDDHLREVKEMAIDKACEWLKNNLGYYDRYEVHIGKSYEEVVIDAFRKDMEE